MPGGRGKEHDTGHGRVVRGCGGGGGGESNRGSYGFIWGFVWGFVGGRLGISLRMLTLTRTPHLGITDFRGGGHLGFIWGFIWGSSGVSLGMIVKARTPHLVLCYVMLCYVIYLFNFSMFITMWSIIHATDPGRMLLSAQCLRLRPH